MSANEILIRGIKAVNERDKEKCGQVKRDLCLIEREGYRNI